jgi:NADH dehydrogenase [ubiquinone] 1 alpha subcomplex assembly factor 7
MSLKAKLAEKIAGRIAASGPITVAAFMTACLHDPEFGYYATRPAIGAEGDFLTAPMVSQMFGELIGLWAAEDWRLMGRPAPFRLIEMGPGDGTLMRDVLRAARVAPDFLTAADLWLVETSVPLRALQQGALAADHAPRWAASLDDVPGGAPMILIANELLDCLPARQLVRAGTGWAERMVGADGDGGLRFGLSAAPEALIPELLRNAPPGATVEVSTAQANLGRLVGERIARDGGAALFIDYGRAEPGVGDTLQAILRHQKVDVLATAGEADLTVHADFPAFAAGARAAGAQATAIVTQGDFLRALGVEMRAEALMRGRPDRADALARQLHRLIAPEEMGSLFKAVAIHSPGLDPPGF